METRCHIPYIVNIKMDLSRQNLSKLPDDLPEICDSSFNCSSNNLSSLKGSPRSIVESFSCNKNKLSNLIGGLETVGSFFICNKNPLTSLAGVPKFIGTNFWSYFTDDLKDVSDIWNSIIVGNIYFSTINPYMAILPLVKFTLNCSDDNLQDIMRINIGSSKQNIIDLQYDLIENGYAANAKWKPE